MKSLIYLSLISMACLLYGCGGKSKKASSDYTFLQWGEYLEYYGKTDSAFLMYSRATNSSTDSMEKSSAYNYMGILQRKTGDLYGSHQSLTAALKPLNPKNQEHREFIGIVCNAIGNASLEMKRYDEAIQYYDSAISIITDKSYILEIMNGKATALQKKGNYKDAIAIYDSILNLQPADKVLTARAISNRARTKWLENSSYPALQEYRTALQIRLDSMDHFGQNASYAHLSDYYAGIRPDSALLYAKKMHQKANELNSPDDILESIDKLIRLNNDANTKNQWYETFKKLNDSLQLSRNTSANRFALIISDVQKSKADNLQLQQHITKQRLWMYGLMLLVVLIISAVAAWYHKRRKRIKQESENAIRDARLKTSQKIHDVVANGLYSMMNEIEHTHSVDRELLINRIESLYEKSRNISYEDSPDKYLDYDSQIHQLVNSFSNEHTKVIVVGNQPVFWSKITPLQKYELQLVLNELLINMKKHSHAKNVVLLFKLENDTGFIHYRDDGIGISPGIDFGNGLKNTVSRIKSLNGQVIFEKNGEQGVSIAISFPLEYGKT